MKNLFEKFANERLSRTQQNFIKGGTVDTEEEDNCSFWDKVRDTAFKYTNPTTSSTGTTPDYPCAA